MDKVCNFCGHAHFRHRQVQYIYRHAGKYLIVNQVPCEECEYCGEQYFAAPVLRKIEAEFHAIHVVGRPPTHSISVPVEEYAHAPGNR